MKIFTIDFLESFFTNDSELIYKYPPHSSEVIKKPFGITIKYTWLSESTSQFLTTYVHHKD